MNDPDNSNLKYIHMKKILCVIIGFSMLISAGCDSSFVNHESINEDEITSLSMSQQNLSQSEIGENIPGSYLIQFKGKKVPKDFSDNIEALNAEIIYQHPSGFVYVNGLSEEAASTIGARSDISNFAADASFILDIPEQTQTVEAEISSTENPAGAFFFARQWHHRAIGADAAWAAGYLGDQDVTVSILDTGIDYTNLDLAGLVDLSRSVSFRPDEDALLEDNFPGRHPISDLQYHGTHVAATIASNGLIGAGVTSKTNLMGVKVCAVDRSCTFGAIISGLLYSAENGADVINMSLGGAFPKSLNGPFVGFINSTMNQVNRMGSVVVVSAGNEAEDLDKNGELFNTYCDAPNVICVSATGPTGAASINGPFFDVDTPAYYTNYGRSSIDVAAPGGNEVPVYSTCTQTSLVVPVCQTGNFIIGISGTSMAAPHVSALAALLISQGSDSPSKVRSGIQQSADDLGLKGTDDFYGKGRINVAAALGL